MISMLLSLFSHVSSDFIFQTNNMCKNKLHDDWIIRIRANFKHSLITFVTLMLLLGIFYSSIADILIFSIIIAACHFLIDCSKSFICKNIKNEWTRFIAFFIDQFIHLLIMLLIWTRFNFKINWISQQFKKTFSAYILNYYGIKNLKFVAANLLIFLIILIYVTLGGSVIISDLLSILRRLRKKTTENSEEGESFLLYKGNEQSGQKQTITQTAATKEHGNKEKGANTKKKNRRKNKSDKNENKALNAVSSMERGDTVKETPLDQVTVTAGKEEDNSRKDVTGKYFGILERIII